MTLARDIGTGPTRKFGGALNRHQGEPIPIITERPLRLKMLGPCKICGEKQFCCECELEDEE